MVAGSAASGERSTSPGAVVMTTRASAGRSVIVLEQAHPLRFQALPAEMAAETNAGRVGFLPLRLVPVDGGAAAMNPARPSGGANR